MGKRSKKKRNTDQPAQPLNCPAAFGQRPDKFLPQCLTCPVDEDCRSATSPTGDGRQPPRQLATIEELFQRREEEYQQFKNIVSVQTGALLRRRFFSHVSEWTNTDIGWHMEIPHCLQDEVFHRILEKYNHLWNDYDQYIFELPEVRANSACIAAGDAFVDLSGCIDSIIEKHRKEVIQEIATIALKSLPNYEEGPLLP